ncbi:MAG: hypothetical protein K0S23_1247 [Fluviicola sp.]|jgi:hypothetical protein|uniref:hypothetical protein n=1 Tax=Fluviicola sp. TaxID=1917219 RepID=UPI00263860EA|nr:hypothetical protein [Fluviicola sp.]MDF3026940.1 hypothetical protein [Fluviicola sp.]
MKQFCTIIAGLFLFSYSSQAQSLIDDLKAVSSVLDTAKSVKIQVVCKVYSKKGGDLVSSINTGITKKGKMSVSLFDNLEIFTNEKYGVYVDKENESIMVVSKSKHAARLNSMGDKHMNEFVSWMKKQQTKVDFKPVLISEEAGIRSYSVTSLDDLKELIVSINVTNHTIEKISYEYVESSQQKQHYILLDYTKFLINSKEIDLDQKDYYIQQSGKFLPGNKYKSYSISTDL